MKNLIAEVAQYLDGIILPNLDPVTIARALVNGAEPVDGRITIEVPGRYTRDGNPIPATFDWKD